MSLDDRPSSIYLREARVDEFDTILRLITRAFFQCPVINWCGSLSQLAPVPSRDQISTGPVWELPKHAEFVYYIRYSQLVTTRLAGGRITVTVRRYSDGSERIVAVASWLPPGSTAHIIRNIHKFNWHRPLLGACRRPRGWGFGGLLKNHLRVIPAMAKSKHRACSSCGIDIRKCWTLSDVATDPDEAGKGLCRMLLEFGMAELVKDAPICLVTVNAKARNIYSKIGFETIDTITLGSGKTTNFGLVPKGVSSELLPGFQCWAMVKCHP